MSTDPADRLARGEELDFRADRTGTIFLLIVSAGFAIIGLCLLGGGDGLIRMVGVALAVFFGAVGLPLVVWRLIRPRVDLRVSAERGVWLVGGEEWLPWGDIRSIDREVVAARPTIILRLTPDAQQRWDARVPEVEPTPGGPGVIVPQTIAADPKVVHRALVAARGV